MATLDLTPDQLLTTTRAVRKRLDFSRPVPDDVVRECVATAFQSPSGSNNPTMQFVVVRDEAKRRAIGEMYRQCFAVYKSMDGVYVGSIDKGSDEANAQQQRVASSADYLGEHMGEAPVLVIACTAGRTDGQPGDDGGLDRSATCSRPCGASCWRPARGASAPAGPRSHLMQEQAVADIVGIPFEAVQQVCLSPLAYTNGTDFKPAVRPDPDTIIHWDTW